MSLGRCLLVVVMGCSGRHGSTSFVSSVAVSTEHRAHAAREFARCLRCTKTAHRRISEKRVSRMPLRASSGVKMDFATAIQGLPYLDERVHFATQIFVIGQAPITDAYPDTSTC